MPTLTFSRRIALVLATLAATNVAPATAATAIGHASVTILATAAVIETTPLEMDSVGNRISTRPGTVTLAGAPKMYFILSVSANESGSGRGPALHPAAFTHDGGRAPTL